MITQFIFTFNTHRYLCKGHNSSLAALESCNIPNKSLIMMTMMIGYAVSTATFVAGII
jgi:hypothetical protein